MKIVKMDKGPPTIEEGRRRLDTLFEDFISSVTETLNYAQSVEEGVRKIDDILNAEFGLEKEIVFTPDFLSDDPE